MEEKCILHYTTGLNKYRGGGLTKYVDDLTFFQSKKNNIIILYPGKYKIFSKRIRIKKEKKEFNKQIYSIINPLSLTMTFGLQDKNYLNKHSNKNLWKNFLKRNSINIIHVHTLMGLYEEFFVAANELNIPIIYSTHDFFGLCPKESFIYNGKICKNWETCLDCPKCNIHAFKKWKIYLIHSKAFCSMRRFEFFKKIKIKAKKKMEYKKEKIYSKGEWSIEEYVKLREKMIKIFNRINYFHFNSSISKEIFEKFVPNINGEVINITHKDILDNRRVKNFESNKLRVTYLGPTTEIKGFNYLINVIDKIYEKNKNIELRIYSYTDEEREYLKKDKTSYKYNELKEIMENTDVVVAISKCYETFGFVIEEALSYGVPVIVSNTMGVKDLITNQVNGYVINPDDLYYVLIDLITNKELLKKMNINIIKSNFCYFEKHCNDIYKLYDNFIN